MTKLYFATALLFSGLALLVTSGEASAKEPDHIKVQHILIGFAGSVPGKPITRTREEAEKLAKDVFAKVKKEAKNKKPNFTKLVTEYTNDASPGIYAMSNRGVEPKQSADPQQREFPRQGMVPAFGDVGFGLKVKEVGLAKYDPQKSPFGYHIIIRLE